MSLSFSPFITLYTSADSPTKAENDIDQLTNTSSMTPNGVDLLAYRFSMYASTSNVMTSSAMKANIIALC